MDLANKTILITGASSGLGAALAFAAARQGANLVLCARRGERLRQVAAKARALSGKRALAVRIDLTQPAQIEQLQQVLKRKVGAVDVLINNAGAGYFERALDFPMAKTRQLFELDVLSLIQLTQQVGLGMAALHQGLIVNIASQAGKLVTPKASIYAAAKAAVITYSNGLRMELRPLGIHVLTVNPGPIKTEFAHVADPTDHYAQAVSGIALDADQLAARIIRAMQQKRRELNAPWPMELAARLRPLLPALTDRLIASPLFDRK
ncbi:SDR family NAD(P)-dependent oxidoreductase [Loigolactobacillus jiayinensis]|uniref:SDR family NAD(P)-dependent oxidoreductase n=1 Tax=Loigolactobacillus jiayinensis TaxID=2486016 RepID=A0ABW1RDX5_9LACO|nr:SDR family NAD(P)-dependent oxidoreductase [Loigolactobacillus jiayinensis]